MQTRTLAFTAAIALTLGLGIVVAQDAGRGAGRGGGRGRGGIPAPIKITIPAFGDGGVIPAKYGCANGQNPNVSPAIQFSGAPEGTQTYALILHDPDVAIGGGGGRGDRTGDRHSRTRRVHASWHASDGDRLLLEAR